MQIAVLADTHMPRGRRRLPRRCEELLAACELILHAGDFNTGEVLDELECFAPVHGVLGNNDDFSLVGRLPESVTVELGGARIGLIHDAGPPDGRLARLRAQFPDADAVVFGHSHLPLHECGQNGFQIFNPGSPTERRRAPQATMGLARATGGRIEFELVAFDD